MSVEIKEVEKGIYTIGNTHIINTIGQEEVIKQVLFLLEVADNLGLQYTSTNVIGLLKSYPGIGIMLLTRTEEPSKEKTADIKYVPDI